MQVIDSSLPYTEIVNRLELSEDDCVLIASDITKLALQARKNKQQFNVEAFINSFQQKLPKGTILIPAFTDNIKDGGTFDYNKSKPTTGALSNKIRRNKNFKRSLDPIHSFYIWGKHQEHLTNLMIKNTFGSNSIFEFLHQQKAKMIFIDVDLQHSFTFVHHVEKCLNVNYRKAYTLKINYIDQKEQKTRTSIEFHTKKMGVYTDLNLFEEYLVKKNILKRIKYGEVTVSQLSFDIAHEEIVEWLSSGKKLHGFNLKLFLKQLLKKLLLYKQPVE